MVGRMSLPSDADDDAQRLQNYLMQCTSRDIAAACQAVEAQLQTVGGEHVRDFYRLCFPVVLRKIFGFEDSSAASQPASSAGGWLAQASVPGNEATTRALISLLSPRGSLFSSLLAVDKENFVRYVFPMERLPEWVRNLLSQEKGAHILCQVSDLFKSRIMEDANGCMQVHLDVFEYYMFWFAYYAVCKDQNQRQRAAGGRRTSRSSRSSQFRMQLGNWASSIPRLSHSPQAVEVGGSPYLQLLKLYLSHFVILSSPNRGYLGREMQLGDVGGATHGDILIHTLIEFWLVDDDPSPLPLAIRQSLGIQAGGAAAVLSYIPPGADLTDSLKVLIKYLNSNLRLSVGEHTLVTSSSPLIESSLNLRRRLSESPSGHFSSPLSLVHSSGASQFPSASNAYLQALHRPLYRFLHRAFRLWPIGTSVRKIAQVVDVWVEYLEPWNTGLDAANVREQAQLQWQKDVGHIGSRDFGPRLSPSLSFKKSDGGSGIGFTVSKALDRRISVESFSELWQGYVLANYHFYTSLVTNFLEFALKFVHMDPEAIFQMVYKVLSVLAKSKELLDLLRKVDVAYGGHMYGRTNQRHNVLFDLAPTIQEQLQDWEEGAETDEEQERGDGLMLQSPLRNKLPQLRLFSMSDNGGNRLLQALFMRAEIEIQASSEKPPLSVHALESVKEVARKIFDMNTMESPSVIFQPGYCQSPIASQLENLNGHEAASTRSLGLQRHSWQDVKYKGDWMRRPIESTEVAFLARVFVRMSDAINRILGLTTDAVKIGETPSAREGVEGNADQSEPEVVPPSSSEQNEVTLSDVLNFVKNLLWQILLVLQSEARDRGWRVNLRFLAGKKFLVLCMLTLLFCWAVRSITNFIALYFS
ncbi:uncharacterized protein [Physcomitrium patens]|uniref:Sphingomyelin phosphodiesterase 4 n=1 Tax=Physcomitrium patens TaxID=3218 RepID=A0A2K1IZD6_PHYPA|nr:uncharacterized protein LOC112272647 [Physcomitrium patens]XP_024356384.1 uncharacterized protein LOC112272647 [Physcomitrium patens]PNR34642.1 hypothetical protein PHYPA_024460 [Physcomitrium patens]|eukprot:XP_024356383.1 uncharacterized protein LOC112272647 [Physcomitrella patens]